MKSNVMIARFLRTLDLMDQAGERVPGLMLSHAGFGKTTTVRLYSKYYDYNCVELIPSQYAADDVVGVQVFDSDTHQLVRKAPSWFRRLKELVESNGKRTILFIDEITTCNPYIQGPLLDLIFSRSIGEEKLPENVMVVAAGNYASDLNGEFTMSSPLINRFVLLNLAREDFDIREVLDGPISTVKTSEDIKKFLDLEESDHPVYDYKAFIDWLYDSKNVDFVKYTPEEIDEIGLVGFTSIRSLDFSTRYARKYMETYTDNSWIRVVGDTLGTSAKKEGKPLRHIIEMEENKFCKSVDSSDKSLGEILSDIAKADSVSLEDLNKLKRVVVATPSTDITNHNLKTLIDIIKSGKPGVKQPLMSDCVTLLTNKFNEL